MGIFGYHLQGKLQAQEGVGKYSPEALALSLVRVDPGTYPPPNRPLGPLPALYPPPGGYLICKPSKTVKNMSLTG